MNETAIGRAAGADVVPLGRVGALGKILRLRSDAGLAERYAAGDEDAFSVLYERHRGRVLAVCLGVLGSREDAEDAAQEVFASLAVTLRRSRPRDFRAWLGRVARNAAIDVARRRRERGCLDEREIAVPAPAAGACEEVERVLAGIRALPESQRSALVMRELAGYSYREIGAVLAVDEEAVRGLISRARVGLRNYREASELPCATARETLLREPDGRRLEKTARRHLRHCSACRAYRDGLRSDARALRAIVPLQASGFAGGSAFAGAGVKLALAGGAVTQLGAACAVSVCAMGGAFLLYDQPSHPSHAVSRLGVTAPARLGGGAGWRAVAKKRDETALFRQSLPGRRTSVVSSATPANRTSRSVTRARSAPAHSGQRQRLPSGAGTGPYQASGPAGSPPYQASGAPQASGARPAAAPHQEGPGQFGHSHGSLMSSHVSYRGPPRSSFITDQRRLSG